MLDYQGRNDQASTGQPIQHHEHLNLLHESPLFWRLIEISKSTASASSLNDLMTSILAEAQAIANADGGTLYLVEGDGGARELKFAIVRNDSLDLQQSGASTLAASPIPLFKSGEPNFSNVASYSALKNQIVNVEDIYQDLTFDFAGTKSFDLTTGYRTHSVLTVPLRNSDDTVIGVLQLLNARDAESGEIIPFSAEVQAIVQALAALVSLSLDNYLLADRQSSLLIRLSSCENSQQLFERILYEAQRITHAEGGTLYIKKGDMENLNAQLEFAVFFNKPLGIYRGGVGQPPAHLPAVDLFDESGEPNLSNVASHAVHMKQTVNIKDAYGDKAFDFDGTIKFDEANGYRSQSFLTVPLLDHDDDVIGVLQLINAQDPDSGKIDIFSRHNESIINALAKYAAITLNTQNLLKEHKDLLDAFIRCIAKAIDAKSKFTAAHCERVPLLTMMIAQAGISDNVYLKDFDLNEDELYELEVAGWLHDCGKLSTPDRVLDKSTKLHLLQDSIEQVALRVELLKREYQLDLLQQNYRTPWQILIGAFAVKAKIDQLAEDLDYLRQANKGGEFMSQEDKARVVDIANLLWTDAQGRAHPLLSDQEVQYLCIERGTLSVEERHLINEHIVVTIDMLESLPFPKKLRRVAEYAGGHHEKMDGTGFPKGLSREEMSIPARMMAVADIFEALTAPDRPYKKTMKISEALSIMKGMRDRNHIDPDIFNMFVNSHVWQTYGEKYLNPEQLDVDDTRPYLDA